MAIVYFTMSSMAHSAKKFELYKMHKAFSITVLSLIVIRILWRITNANVQAAEGVPPVLQWAAKWSFTTLYIYANYTYK